MPVSRRASRVSARLPVVLPAVVVGVILVLLAWLGLVASRRELLELLREQAAVVTHTVAAAARANDVAAREAEAALVERMLDNARMLAELDRAGQLDAARLDELVQRHGLFRASVLDADGTPVLGSGGGAGRWGRGRGRGGFGPGPRHILERLRGGEQEVTTGVHQARFGRGARLAVGVRRRGGGAIILHVDATDVAALHGNASLTTLLDDIIAGAPDIAYVVFEHEGEVVSGGATAPGAAGSQGAAGTASEREVVVGGRRAMEFSLPIALDGGDERPATLRLALYLGGIERGERRMALLLVASLVATAALVAFGVGAAWLRRRYALLSTQHARAQEALRRRDRLAAMGELAATVAHEIRNPLNAIGMSAQRLRREVIDTASSPTPQDREGALELLGVVEDETRRIDHKVQQFLDFARPPALAPRPTSLAQLVSVAADAARGLGDPRGVTVEAQLEGAAEADVDPEQMRQVLDNLLRNAVEATPSGGSVVVAAQEEADGHRISVRDSGEGIPEEILPRVFDLYFTTKAEGTGVGLAVSQQIVAAHGGTIEVASRPGAGTTMTVRLPISRSKSDG